MDNITDNTDTLGIKNVNGFISLAATFLSYKIGTLPFFTNKFWKSSDPSLACLVACVECFLKFTSGATNADLLVASMAAELSDPHI